MLGFRSLYRTHDTPELLGVVAGQLFGWIDGKGYDAGAVTPGATTEIGDDVWATLQFHADEVGSETMRAQVVENATQGAWVSELTAHSSPTGNRGWVWLDIHNPRERGWTATPRLARSLVDALPARDGSHHLGARPRRTDPDGVDEVVAALRDPARRGLAFVAGTEHSAPFGEWNDAVVDLLHDTVGLANAWILTADATERFNFLVGRTHQVPAGSIRTYLPRVTPHDALDGERHRFLTGRSIAFGSRRALRKVLGHRAREQMIAAPMPQQLRDLERILKRKADTDLLEELVPPTSAEPSPHNATATSEVLETELQAARPAPEEAPATVVERDAPAPPALPVDAQAELADLVRDVLGISELTSDAVARLREAVRAPHDVTVARDRIGARLDGLRSAVEEAEFERDLAREELVEERQERAAAEEERADAERRLRYVQRQLAAAGRADEAWTEPDLDVRDIRPDSFTELLFRVQELTHVVVTGRSEVTENLDDHGNARSWAGRAWEALLALDDYARISVNENFANSVAGYLTATPAGCRGFSANRHAYTESEDVQNNPRFRRPRELPVPTEIDDSGRVFMGAHFKLAQSAMISPRIHYHDATARTGVVYVGYIGPHLPTSES